MKKVLLIALFTVIAGTSHAMVFGGSNLGIFGYPEFKSYSAPYNPATASSYEMQSYRDDVEKYIRDANSDIERIQEAKQKAISDYNRAVRQYNSGSYY
nr:MAG TPA: LemA family [Caudoviricetes sp.]